MRQPLRLCCALFVSAIVPVSLACGKASPTSSSGIPLSPSPPSPHYAVSGVVSEYRGRPLSGVTVEAIGYPQATTQTDDHGHYSLSELSGGLTLFVYKRGYVDAEKYALRPEDQTVDFTLHPDFLAGVGDEPVSGSIWGDEFLSGDDPLSGLCTHTPCKIVQIGCSRQTGCSDSASAKVEIRLRWSNPATQLALYVPSHGVFANAPIPAAEVQRYCCSSEVVGTFSFDTLGMTDYAFFVVGFEQAAGGRPGPTTNQPFEILIRPLP